MNLPIERQWQLLARNNFAFYLEYVHHGRYIHAKHTELICEKLMAVERGEIKRLMLFLPPRHSKSNTCSESFPSWFLGRNPHRRVMLLSYSDTLARQFGRKNRQKMQEFGMEIFGQTPQRGNMGVNNWNIEGNVGGMLSQGIEGSYTGTGASLLVIDDPHRNRESVTSDTQRDKVYEEYKSSIMTRLTPDARVILIQTRWHELDLAGSILANEEGWEVLSLPAIAGEDDPLGRQVGDPLWPEYGFDITWLNSTKTNIGSYAFNSLYQQTPTAEDGNIIKRHWLKYYDQPPAHYDEVIISLDAAFKGNEDSDFCAFTVWGTVGADKYLIDIVRERLDFPQTVAAFRSLVAQYPMATAKLVEDAANGPAIVATLARDISGIVPVKPEGGKIARLFAVSPQFEAGNVYLPTERRMPKVFDYVTEMVSFPNGKNDDTVDSTSQALNYLESRQVFMFGRAF